MRPKRILFESLNRGQVRCLACARHCTIDLGGRGFCRVRTNSNGTLVPENYGRVVAAHIDTVEKRPVYHYRPGSKLLSIGTVGCNWTCDFCINAHVSQADEIVGKEFTPEEIIQLARRYRCQGIAYTYNEPLVFLEYARDTGVLAHREGLFNVVVSNGYGTPEAVGVLSEFADCVTVGLKANASPSFLKRHADVPSLEAVYQTLLGLKKSQKVHVEISDLVIDETDEALEEAKMLCEWAAGEIGADTPFHFVRFYPSNKMTAHASTSSDVLTGHCEIAKSAGLRYVYVANYPGHERESTYCPNCGQVVVGRFGYEIRLRHLDNQNRCKACGHPIPIAGGFAETPPEERYVPIIFPPMDMLYVCEALSG